MAPTGLATKIEIWSSAASPVVSARAFKVWAPFGTEALFQLIPKGRVSVLADFDAVDVETHSIASSSRTR